MAKRLLLPLFLIIALLLGLNLLFGEGQDSRRTVKWVYESWWMSLREEDWQTAYQRMAPAYRERVSPEQFYREFYFVRDEDFRLHDRAKVDCYQRSARIFPGDAMNDELGGPEFSLIRLGDTWYLTGKVVRKEQGRSGAGVEMPFAWSSL